MVTELIVVGGSAGAVEALTAILPALPATFPVPIAVVVHLPPRRPSLLAELFRSRCALDVREALDKAPILPGITFAPPDYHLLVEADGTFALSIDPPVNWSRPSIDVFFASAAAACGSRVLAVVLTGASADGAEGARAIRQAGGIVLVQLPETAVSREMPERAIERAQPQATLTLADLSSTLRNLEPPRDAP
jgi:two-component system chemotaxis response regulator CheB